VQVVTTAEAVEAVEAVTHTPLPTSTVQWLDLIKKSWRLAADMEAADMEEVDMGVEGMEDTAAEGMEVVEVTSIT
jgi:hypothetical protein